MGDFLDFIYNGYNYKLYVPSEYHSDQAAPLLVMLHGCGQNPEDFAAGTNMNVLAEKENFLVLYPDMNRSINPTNLSGYNPYGCWNWFYDQNQHRGQGHPKLIYEMIHEVKSKYKIDSNKVYAAGLSAGGSLACILGVTYPDVFNGIAIFSGLAYGAANVLFLFDPTAEAAKHRMEKGVPDPYECGNRAFQEMGEFKKKMRVIVFHGICDTVVHPINGKQVITQWAQTNFLVEGGIGLADVTPNEVHSGIMNERSYTQQIYHDGDDLPLLELWMFDLIGHTWSGGNPEGSYTDALGPNATEILWNFFNKPQQQLEENRIETTAIKPIYPPAVLPDDLPALPVTLPIPTIETVMKLPREVTTKTAIEETEKLQIEPPSEGTIITPIVETEKHQNELPSELTVKTPIQGIDTTQTESPSESTKRNAFSSFLSKLMKRKNRK
ncbi:PHB depolymerase family esterase [Niallia sp. XMNu-256]|uniref:extracellular catalytic domain type 1 short-chain-length polyhydroxyalkanoate depolymerase n=1 Tax=Niallia sp. XMNu-256 TaxID=3082444 RepID=UPI0030CFD828